MQVLHHVGRIGAQHHHLAMRHVDDAHHAEGDGEADGREQQHRTERQAVPEVLNGAHKCEIALDGLDRGGSGGAHSAGASTGTASQQRGSESWSPRMRMISMAAILSAGAASSAPMQNGGAGLH